MDPVQILSGMEVFSHLSAAQLDQLGRCASLSRFPAGVTVVKHGDPTHDAYAVGSGLVRIERQTSYGEFTLARLGPGELFGETSFVDREARSGDAVTEVDSQLAVLNPVALSTLIERDQRFELALYWAFWRSLSRKLRETNQQLGRFFTEGGKPPAKAEPPVEEARGGFRVDMAAKRILFAEQRLPSMEINFLSSLSREKKLEPGEVLFREGEPGDTMYVVLEGQVRISKEIFGTGEEALAVLGRGEFFGEMALIDNQPRSADARAHEGGAVVLGIPREVVSGILDIHKVSSVRLLKILCRLVAKRLREVDEKIIGWFILAGGSAQTPR